MKHPRLHQILFWFLVLATLWFSIGQCNQGRISEAFTQSEAGLEQNLTNITRINQQLRANLNMLAGLTNDSLVYKIPMLERLEISLRSYHRFVENIRGQLQAAAKHSQTPNDCHLTAKLLLEGSPSLLQQLSSRTDSLRKTMIALVDSAEYALSAIPLDFAAQNNGQYRFQDFSGNFRELPLSGARAVLVDVQLSAAMSFTAVLQYLASRMCVADIYWIPSPFLVPRKTYLFAGDSYEADVFLSTYTHQVQILKITVNGVDLPINNFGAHYETSTFGVGERSLNVSIVGSTFRNSKYGTTIDTFTVQRAFCYEVGTGKPFTRCPEGHNFLYLGIENPVSYYAGDGQSHAVLRAKNAALKSIGAGHYTLLPSTLQPVEITAGSIANFSFPVRPIPNPAPLFANQSSGSIPQNLIVSQTALATRFPEHFDLEASCQILGFQLSRFRAREDSEEAENDGPNFNQQVLALLHSSLPGDRLLFENIQVKCSGDTKPRQIEHLSVRVK